MLTIVLTAALLAGVPLIDAVKTADREAVRALLQKKVDVNAAEGDGTTALLWASYKDDVEIADLLIRAGANVNAANDLGATAALGGQPERQCGDGQTSAPGGSEPEHGAAVR